MTLKKSSKTKTKSLPKLKAELEAIFNEFIRLRDYGLPCISCGKVTYLQAGHYFPVNGYGGLRFDEDNVNGECAGCNCFDKSHLIGYGINLKIKIGEERYSKLLEKAADYKMNGYKWSRSELLEKIQHYKNKVAELKK